MKEDGKSWNLSHSETFTVDSKTLLVLILSLMKLIFGFDVVGFLIWVVSTDYN